jgi:hypothetical protein
LDGGSHIVALGGGFEGAATCKPWLTHELQSGRPPGYRERKEISMRWLLALLIVFLLIIEPIRSATAAGPELTVQTPADGAVIEGPNVQVAFTASGITIVPSSVPVAEAGKHPEANRPGEGHVHLVLDLQPLVIWYENDPYTFMAVPPGEHQLMVELVNNDHSSFSPPVMQRIRFRVADAQRLPKTGAESDRGALVALLSFAIILITAGRLILRLGRR